MDGAQLVVLRAFQRLQIAERSEAVAFDVLQMTHHGYFEFDQTGQSGERGRVQPSDGVGVEVQLAELNGVLQRCGDIHQPVVVKVEKAQFAAGEQTIWQSLQLSSGQVEFL